MKIILSSLIILCSMCNIAYADYPTPLGAEYPAMPVQETPTQETFVPAGDVSNANGLIDNNPGNTNPTVDQQQNNMYQQYNNNF